jgi:hypothetical protein
MIFLLIIPTTNSMHMYDYQIFKKDGQSNIYVAHLARFDDKWVLDLRVAANSKVSDSILDELRSEYTKIFNVEFNNYFSYAFKSTEPPFLQDYEYIPYNTDGTDNSDDSFDVNEFDDEFDDDYDISE